MDLPPCHLIQCGSCGSAASRHSNWKDKVVCKAMHLNTLRLRQNGCHFANDSLKCIFVNENVWILIKISLKLAPKSPINNIIALVLIIAWCQLGDKPLSELLLVRLLTHIYASLSLNELRMMLSWCQYEDKNIMQMNMVIISFLSRHFRCCAKPWGCLLPWPLLSCHWCRHRETGWSVFISGPLTVSALWVQTYSDKWCQWVV